jgi:PAS domain S-box-containing protein
MEQQIVDALEINTAILESSPLAIYAYNLSGQCVLTNDAGAVIGGGTKEQILEVNFNNHEHWKETGLLESVNRVLSTGTPEHREVFMRNVFAKQGWFDFRFSRFFSGGEPHLLLVYDDVTERKQAEETIRQSEEKYSKAFHGMPIMMTLASIEEGRFIDANAALYAESGYSPEEIIGHTSLELNLFPNSVRADFIAILLQEGRLENFEVDMRNKAGEIRNCLCWSQLIQVHNQLCNMTATIDITEQRRVQKELEQVERFNFISEMAVSMSSRFEEKLQIATEETRQELDRFKEAFSRAVGLEKIVINSESMKKIFLLAAKMHEDRKLPVLIEGETGTGKEVIAKYIHYGNGNVTTPFIALNCAAIAPSIFESELFGYEAGAFTGGLSKGQKGKLDMAKGGTLFLDEITELPIDLQAKLLRVLQENEYFRVGGQKVLHTDVRIICATNQKIEDMVAEGRFRQDLYYRLNVGRIHLPPLRERVEDILPLAYSFLTAFAEEKGSQFRAINQEAGKILEAYEWPGNVREIRNAMQRVVLLWDGWEVKPQYLDFLHNSNRTGQLQNDKSPAALDLSDIVLPADKLPIEDVYNAIVSKALAFNNGNKTKTAQYLQISRNSLMYRLKQIEQDAK